MVSFKRISSFLCVCAILCCFIGMAMPVSAANTDAALFSDLTFDYAGFNSEDGVSFYLYQCISSRLTYEDVQRFVSSSGSNQFFFLFNSSFVECSVVDLDDSVALFSSDQFELPMYVLQLSRETIGGLYDFFTFVSSVDLGPSLTLSVTNYMQNSDPAVSGFLADLGDVASSSLSLVSSVVTTIVNNPFLLLTVGFFFAGAAVAILGRILGKS